MTEDLTHQGLSARHSRDTELADALARLNLDALRPLAENTFTPPQRENAVRLQEAFEASRIENQRQRMSVITSLAGHTRVALTMLMRANWMLFTHSVKTKEPLARKHAQAYESTSNDELYAYMDDLNAFSGESNGILKILEENKTDTLPLKAKFLKVAAYDVRDISEGNLTPDDVFNTLRRRHNKLDYAWRALARNNLQHTELMLAYAAQRVFLDVPPDMTGNLTLRANVALGLAKHCLTHASTHAQRRERTMPAILRNLPKP